jgi:hypothetical protein
MSCTRSGPDETPWQPLCSITGPARTLFDGIWDTGARRRALYRAEPILDYTSAVSRLTAT